MKETIKSISEWQGTLINEPLGSLYAGYKIMTTDQEVLLLIYDEKSCCESYGYFMSQDEFDEFIGTELLSIEVVDTELKSYEFLMYDDSERAVMFVNINTSVGVLQFVAYNSHNGYYGHDARVVSKQLNHQEIL